MITLKEFQNDSQGRTFTDVLNDKRINYAEIIKFFNDPARKLRMEDSETHHNRPALAGVVKELEERPNVDRFFRENDGHTTTRFKQCIGTLVRVHMEKLGWSKTGTKGSLGKRHQTEPNTTTPGAYFNDRGVSRWFTRAERYIKKDN